MLTVDGFENGWVMLLDEYNLWRHPYMTQLLEIRKKWTKPYFEGVLCATMST